VKGSAFAFPIVLVVAGPMFAACGGYVGGNAPRPAEPPTVASPVEEVESSLAESHEKSVETAKEAAGAVNEGAESAAAGAKDAVTNPDEAAKQAVEATALKSKQVALSFKDDMYHFPERVWDDVKEIPSWRSAIVLGAGAALAGMSDAWWDEDVRHAVDNDRESFGHVENNALNVAANPEVLFAGSSILYGGSLLVDSPRVHDFALDMMSALTIEMPIVFVLKEAFHTTRPNGDSNGFPSGHTAGAVSLATLLGTHFGLYPAIAGYTFAGFVAWHRIDSGKHDLSDVIFGAALGYTVDAAVGDASEEVPLLHAHWAPTAGLTHTAPGLSLGWRC
jgi:PAP2 superfamily protein